MDDEQPKTPNSDASRKLILPCTPEEWGLWVWAARQSGQKITPFGKAALRAAVQAVARDLVARGKPLPQWVAEALREPET